MQYQTLAVAASTMATLVGVAQADFWIYQVVGTASGIRTGPAADNSWMITDDKLDSCSTFENSYAEIAGVGDASDTLGVRCDGCTDDGQAVDPTTTITQLEIDADSMGWGHYTIYSESDDCTMTIPTDETDVHQENSNPPWQLTPASDKSNGGKINGQCHFDTSSNMTCNGLGASSANSVFSCQSSLKGIHARS